MCVKEDEDGTGRSGQNQRRSQAVISKSKFATTGSFQRLSVASSVSAQIVMVMRRSNGTRNCAGVPWREITQLDLPDL